MSYPKFTNYACHRLIDECGGMHASSIIKLDDEGRIVGIIPFNQEEQPFTQWLGGTILLTQDRIPPLTQGKSLEEHRCKAGNHPDTTAPLYAWHTPLLDMDIPLSSPLTPLN